MSTVKTASRQIWVVDMLEVSRPCSLVSVSYSWWICRERPKAIHVGIFTMSYSSVSSVAPTAKTGRTPYLSWRRHET
jgi:hypothetical protein